MTDRQGALGDPRRRSTRPSAQAALDAFYERFRDDALVLDKWFALQAASQRADTLEQVEALAEHPDFTLDQSQPAALAGRPSPANQRAFHDADGRGYRFLADMILAADKLNPQIAARLVPPLGRWRRFEPKRAALMRAELERIVATPGPVARTCSSRRARASPREKAASSPPRNGGLSPAIGRATALRRKPEE